MAKFYRYNNLYDTNGRRRSEDEIDRMEQEFKQQQELKIKKMTKLVVAGIVGLFLMVFLFKSCERIDAGHVGVKVWMM
jgi:hypothetical protein